MRKLIALFLLVFLLVGCDGDKATPGGDTPVDPEPVPPVVNLFSSHSEGIRTDSTGVVFAMAIISNDSDIAVETLRCSVSLLDTSDNIIKTINETVPRIEKGEEAVIDALAGNLDDNPELSDAVSLYISFGTYKTDSNVYTSDAITIKNVTYTPLTSKTTTVSGTITSSVKLSSIVVRIAGLDDKNTCVSSGVYYRGETLLPGVEYVFNTSVGTADSYKFYYYGFIEQ